MKLSANVCMLIEHVRYMQQAQDMQDNLLITRFGAKGFRLKNKNVKVQYHLTIEGPKETITQIVERIYTSPSPLIGSAINELDVMGFCEVSPHADYQTPKRGDGEIAKRRRFSLISALIPMPAVLDNTVYPVEIVSSLEVGKAKIAEVLTRLGIMPSEVPDDFFSDLKANRMMTRRNARTLIQLTGHTNWHDWQMEHWGVLGGDFNLIAPTIEEVKKTQTAYRAKKERFTTTNVEDALEPSLAVEEASSRSKNEAAAYRNATIEHAAQRLKERMTNHNPELQRDTGRLGTERVTGAILHFETYGGVADAALKQISKRYPELGMHLLYVEKPCCENPEEVKRSEDSEDQESSYKVTQYGRKVENIWVKRF